MAAIFRCLSRVSAPLRTTFSRPSLVVRTSVFRRGLFAAVSEKRYPLSSVAKVELLENETPERIREIWLKHHSKKSCLSAVIPTDVATKLTDRLKESPVFVYPLPNMDSDQEYAVLYQQAQDNSVQYTTVEQFNRYRDAAIPFLSLFFFDEFAQSKGLVLMRGDVNTDVMTVEQAQMLVHHMQIYYLADNHHEFVQMFNHRPKEFDFNMLLINTRAILGGAGMRSIKFETTESKQPTSENPEEKI